MMKTINPSGALRVLVTKQLPGQRWVDILTKANCRIDIIDTDKVVTQEEILTAIGDKCDGVIGQLTEKWDTTLFEALKKAGGRVYSNYAVGFDNVKVADATAVGIPVGNTPGVLTETTAEAALALCFAASRRIVEADTFMRAGKFEGWAPTMYLGKRLHRGTVGVVGCGRIGQSFVKSLVTACAMNVLYVDTARIESFEKWAAAYSDFLVSQGEAPISCRKVELDELLASCDVVSLHTVLSDATRHMIGAKQLAAMKSDAVLVNTSRGPVIDEAALVTHLKANPDFRVGLDVFEREPLMADGLAECPNAVIVPHIASATTWSRGGMATLAASNVAGVLLGRPLYTEADYAPYVDAAEPPAFVPSILNAKELGYGQ